MTQYVNPVGSLEKRLAAIFQVVKDEEKKRTMWPDLPTQYSKSRDLILELYKDHHEAVKILVAGEAEFLSLGSKMSPKTAR